MKLAVFLCLFVTGFNCISQMTDDTIIVEGQFAYELRRDTLLINYWGQNANEYPRIGFTRIDSITEKVAFRKGFFCFSNIEFFSDSLIYEKLGTKIKDDDFFSYLYSMMGNNKLQISYEQDKRAGRILKKLQSNKIREANYSKYTARHFPKRTDLKEEYYTFNITMKVIRCEELDFERLIFHPEKSINPFKMETIPFYRIIEIQNITPEQIGNSISN